MIDMKYPDNIIENLRDVIKRDDDIHLALLYGSAASDRVRHDSDVDIAVSAGHPLSPEERLDLSADLSQVCDRKVDLLDIETAEGLILKEVCTNNIVLKNSKPELYGNLIVRMLDHQTDMMPNIRHIWEKRREKLLS